MFDKYGFIDQMMKKLDEIADSHGVVRCVSISELFRMFVVLKQGLMKDDAQTAASDDEKGNQNGGVTDS